jgi:1,4-alpha-glucan branching enzyme
MHDTLNYLARDPVFRHYHHNEITFSLMYAFSENFVLPLSHDEVVHGKGSLLGKMPGDEWNKFAGLRALFAYMWAHPGKQLLFMGSEFGQGAEWSAERGLDWWVLGDEHHAGIRQLVRDLNRAYRGNPALWALDHYPDGFAWIDANDASGNVLSFLRFAGDRAASDESAGPAAAGSPAAADGPGAAGSPAAADGAAPAEPPAGPGMLACIVNFSGGPHLRYQVGLPRPGRWREVINTDAFPYGGSGVGNQGIIEAVPEPCHGQPASAVFAIPPLGALWLVPDD